jgi:protoporphyrinogen oxidase
MEQVHTLIVGAGVTGLAAAGRLAGDYLVLESDDVIGGYCKTIKRDGFVWDYSGHFFHFRRPAVEQWLRRRMPEDEVLTIQKRAFIAHGGRLVAFPFQKNIHQLPSAEFLECLHDLYFAESTRASKTVVEGPESFRSMLYRRFGRAICEKFLIPYNEKLYACDLDDLDAGAMGRFFPAPSLDDVIRHFREPRDDSYNATFCYPRNGAFEYVRALASAVPPDAISVGEPAVFVDLNHSVVRTPRREIKFDRLISTIPLPRLAQMVQLEYDTAAFAWNKVLVFNLGFDRKGPKDIHWIYYPARETVFYRVGFYDNILDGDRLSLYVEVGLSRDDEPDVERLRERVLEDLQREGLLNDHRLVAEHHVTLDPAYVYVSQRANAERDRLRAHLAARNVHSIGRYGGWRYCSIEDNIVEAWDLVAALENP